MHRNAGLYFQELSLAERAASLIALRLLFIQSVIICTACLCNAANFSFRLLSEWGLRFGRAAKVSETVGESA